MDLSSIKTAFDRADTASEPSNEWNWCLYGLVCGFRYFGWIFLKRLLHLMHSFGNFGHFLSQIHHHVMRSYLNTWNGCQPTKNNYCVTRLERIAMNKADQASMKHALNQISSDTKYLFVLDAIVYERQNTRVFHIDSMNYGMKTVSTTSIPISNAPTNLSSQFYWMTNTNGRHKNTVEGNRSKRYTLIVLLWVASFSLHHTLVDKCYTLCVCKYQ